MPASVTTRAEPPKDTSGNGTPVIGKSPVTAPRLMTVCRPIHDTIPAASSRSNLPGAWIAMRMPAHSRTPNPISTTRVPRSPSSSPITAKMKSEWAFGRKSHFARLVPSPVPSQPPDPIAISPWISW